MARALREKTKTLDCLESLLKLRMILVVQVGVEPTRLLGTTF